VIGPGGARPALRAGELLKSTTSEVYYHEIPGGQYSNLRPQVAELGLLGRWNDVKDAFALVNQLVGDSPKVTPSSKRVGDFAIFLLLKLHRAQAGA
jgi:pyruvate carboxylase